MSSWMNRAFLGYGRSSEVMQNDDFVQFKKTYGVPRLVAQAPDGTSSVLPSPLDHLESEMAYHYKIIRNKSHLSHLSHICLKLHSSPTYFWKFHASVMTHPVALYYYAK